MQSLSDNGKITIILVGEHVLIRNAVRINLEKEPDMVILGETDNAEEVISMAGLLLPSLIIFTSTTPKLDSLRVIERVKNFHPDIALIVLSDYKDMQYVLGVLKAGVTGYLSDNIFSQDLIIAIHAVVSGEAVLSNPIYLEVLRYVSIRPVEPEPTIIAGELSLTDLDILRLIANGHSNQNIALQLQLSPFTVKNYLAEVFSKLNASSRTEAVIKTLRAGLLHLEDL